MAVQAFKYFTIQAGGTPQPLIGTVLSTAVTAAQAAALSLQGGLIQNSISLHVADSSMFIGAQYLSLIDPSTYATESKLRVMAVPDSTHVVVTGLKNAHPGGAYGTGSWVALGNNAQQVYVQALDGNTGSLYLGTSAQMVTSTGVFVIAKLMKVGSGVQPYDFSTSRQGLADAESVSQYWIDGTTSDSYLPSLGLV